jgi:hypothetical protein
MPKTEAMLHQHIERDHTQWGRPETALTNQKRLRARDRMFRRYTGPSGKACYGSLSRAA